MVASHPRKADLVLREQGEMTAQQELAALGVIMTSHAKGTGRPTKFKPEIVRPLLARLAEGETLTAICRDPGMPCFSTVWLWAQIYPQFAKVFERVRAGSFADSLVDQALGRAFDASDKDEAMCARVASETALKVASRIAPHRWGERGDASGGVNIQIVTPLFDQGHSGDQGKLTITVPGKDDK